MFRPTKYGFLTFCSITSKNLYEIGTGIMRLFLAENQKSFEFIENLYKYKFLYVTPRCFSADGEPHITIMSDALVYYTGAVVWKPPSIYKSFCPVNLEIFI